MAKPCEIIDFKKNVVTRTFSSLVEACKNLGIKFTDAYAGIKDIGYYVLPTDKKCRLQFQEQIIDNGISGSNSRKSTTSLQSHKEQSFSPPDNDQVISTSDSSRRAVPSSKSVPKVMQLDLSTNTAVCVYDSILEASISTNFKLKDILDCCQVQMFCYRFFLYVFLSE